jgi:hypothetical protein
MRGINHLNTRLRKFYKKKDELCLDFAYSRPINPSGRTGMTGRNSLHNWGINYTADMVVTYSFGGDIKILLMNRKDTGDLALFGGFLDLGLFDFNIYAFLKIKSIINKTNVFILC